MKVIMLWRKVKTVGFSLLFPISLQYLTAVTTLLFQKDTLKPQLYMNFMYTVVYKSYSVCN